MSDKRSVRLATFLFTYVVGSTDLTQAIAAYRDIGMPKHIEMTDALLSEAGPAA